MTTQKERWDAASMALKKELDEYDITQVVRKMFEVLDRTEESDSGKIFHPVTFTSCRLRDGEDFGIILNRLKDMVHEPRT